MRSLKSTLYSIRWILWSLLAFSALSVLFFLDHTLGVMRQSGTSYAAAYAVLVSPGLILQFSPIFTARLFRFLTGTYKSIIWSCAYILVAINIFSDPFPRRVSFFLAFTPYAVFILAELIRIFKDNKNYKIKVFIGLLSITTVMLWLPGGYAPPFYNGIAGWTKVYENPIDRKERPIGGFQITNKSGERIWFSYGIVSPINFVMRHFYGYRKKYPNKMNEIIDFYLASYCFNYDILRDGIFPYQRNLGPFGYPGHTPYVLYNYERFPPSELVSFELVTEYRDVNTGALRDRVTALSFDAAEALHRVGCLPSKDD